MTKGGIVGASTNRCLLELVFKIGGIGGGETVVQRQTVPRRAVDSYLTPKAALADEYQGGVVKTPPVYTHVTTTSREAGC